MGTLNFLSIEQMQIVQQNLRKLRFYTFCLIKEGMIETSKIQKFDIEKAKSGKAVRTRNGMEVRIICYNRENRDKKCIVALIKNKNGNEQVQNYYADGTSSSVGRDYDLFITDENG